ncbi:MAG TPA: glycosyltransferase family 2 protein [Acidimicrobiales bacterium]|nr:glycosyltransferase family 2 protein [Acidimicrobiales bacterium]
MAEDQAPPVVAVVVSNDPGPWFEECLESLAAQDYAALTVLVVDAGSREPLAPRVAAVAPDFYLTRTDSNAGFGPSANVVLDLVEGGSHFLFCHDDVVLAPDALRRMVEESFRSNAGIVTPKLVDYDDADRILQLGLGVDRFGAPVRRVGRREFDQAQHDEVREVFAAPGGCTLARTDLFAAIGGYDREISMFGEDVDLCWRARLAGARVVVAPSAQVRHREATAARQRPLPEARALQWRHELRAVLKNYGRWRLWLVGAQLVVLSLAEMAYFLAIGKRWRARQVLDAWRWNLAAPRRLRQARADVGRTRRLPDRLVCGLFTRRTSRLWRFVEPLLEERALRWGHASRSRQPAQGEDARPGASRVRRVHRPRQVRIGAALVVLVVLFGARSLIFGHLPLVGGLLPLPSPAHLLARFFGGWRDAGMQRPGPAPPAFALLGLAGFALLGAMGQVLKVGIALCLVAGALGAARLVRPVAGPAGRLAAAAAYLFLPLAWNDLARGDVLGLVAYAGAPYVLARIWRAHDSAGGGALELAREVLALGALLALCGAFVPLLALLAPVCAVAVALGSLLAGRPAGGARCLAVSVGGLAVAFALLFPWSLTFVQPGARLSALAGPLAAADHLPSLAALARFDVGPFGAGPLGDALVLSALLPVLVARGERFVWAARGWAVALGVLALSWALAEGWLGAGGGETRVVLAPAAAAIAALVGDGVAAVRADVVGRSFGWRHVAAAGWCCLVAAGALPVLGATLGGRFGLPTTGYDAVLSWIDSGPPARVLWLGDGRALPLGAWQVAPGLALGVSEGGLPDATRLWPSANPGEAAALGRAVVAASSGMTVDLGADLASAGVRYVVVPSALAPVLAGVQQASAANPPEALVGGLAAQADLHQLPSEGGAQVFENAAWRPGSGVPGSLAGPGGTPAPLRGLAVALELALWVAAAVGLARLPSGARARRRGSHARRPAPEAAAAGDLGVLAEVGG